MKQGMSWIIHLLIVCMILILPIAIACSYNQNCKTEAESACFLGNENYYFYVYGSHKCPHCKAVIEFLNSTYGKEHLYFCDMDTNITCYQKFLELYSAGVPGYIPAVFIVYNCTVAAVLIGECEDRTFIDRLMQVNKNNSVPIYFAGQNYYGELVIDNHMKFINEFLRYNGYCAVNLQQTNSGSNIKVVRHYDLAHIIVPLIILSLLDSVNPCTLTLYFSFIITLLAAKKKVFGPSIIFISIIYLGYLGLGLGFKTLAGVLPHKLLLILALLFGIYNIIDAGRRYGRGFECRLCDKFNVTVKIMRNPYTAAILLSIISVTVLLPCTSGPLMVFASIIKDYPLYISIPAFMIYNMFFISPMLILWFVAVVLNKKRSIADFLAEKSAVIEFLAGALLVMIALYYL